MSINTSIGLAAFRKLISLRKQQAALGRVKQLSSGLVGGAVQLFAQPKAAVMAIGKQVYTVECFSAGGDLLWREQVVNLIPTEGLNHWVTEVWKTQTAPSYFVGLIDNVGGTPALAAGDTRAGIHTTAGGANDWAELQQYDETTRVALVLGSVVAGAVDNSASKAVFTMNATVTVKGMFLITNNVKESAAAGLLVGEAFFATAQPVIATNVINVQADISLASA